MLENRFVKCTFLYELLFYCSFIIVSFGFLLSEGVALTSFLSYVYWGSLLVSIVGVSFVTVSYYQRKKIWYYATLTSLIVLLFLILFHLTNSHMFIVLYIAFNCCFIGIIILLLSDNRSYFNCTRISSDELKNVDGYTYEDYTLFFKDISLKGSNRTQRIYFFSKGEPKSGVPCDKPDGFTLGFNKRTGMPYLKREKKK